MFWQEMVPSLRSLALLVICYVLIDRFRASIRPRALVPGLSIFSPRHVSISLSLANIRLPVATILCVYFLSQGIFTPRVCGFSLLSFWLCNIRRLLLKSHHRPYSHIDGPYRSRKSWKVLELKNNNSFPGLESPGILLQDLESPGNLN